jgi:hypothetical protein
MTYKLENLPNGDLTITVDSGKYTFVKPDARTTGRYGVSILRGGEPWVDHPPGENAIMDLMWALEELHLENEKLRAELNRTVPRR